MKCPVCKKGEFAIKEMRKRKHSMQKQIGKYSCDSCEHQEWIG